MPRIGVFVCHCGHNIASTVDIEEVVRYARSLPGVVYAGHNMYSCSEEGLTSIRNSIRENKLDRVVVAACTPRTHEQLFRRACEQAGVNKYLFEFVNIREHVSWIHAKEPLAATEKAKKLVAMGVAKAALLQPQVEGETPVTPVAVVIGGGISGLAAGAALVGQGIETHVIEKDEAVGGLLKEYALIGPELEDPRMLIHELASRIEMSERGHIHLRSEVKEVSGCIGSFEVSFVEGCEERKIKAGAIIVATGAVELVPQGEYGFGSVPGVILQSQLERLLASGQAKGDTVFILCVGSRQPGREYCSRICCNIAVKNALRIIGSSSGSAVTILHRDLMTSGTAAERLYREASEKGVRFVRYGLARPPTVTSVDGSVVVDVFDENLDEEVRLRADRVVLVTPLVSPPGSALTSKMLKVPRDKHGFFLEAHVKLRPNEFATDGVYVCGSARWPVSARECIHQGLAAAAKASIPIRQAKVVSEAVTAFADPEKCAACGNCVLSCPYEAVEIVPVEGKLAARVNEALCKGCGSCVAACPNDAMQQKCFTSQQLGAMIDALVRSVTEGA